MRTGDWEGLHSSGKGLGMEGMEEESDCTPLVLERFMNGNEVMNDLSHHVT